MKSRLSLLAAALVLLFAPLSQAQTKCTATIIDEAGVVHNPQIIGDAARTLINQGADVKVVTVDSIQRYGTSLSDVERSFERSCPNWVNSATGQRKANLFVVMVAPNDRAKNMFLGSYYSGAFDVTAMYSILSNSYFKNRQWEMGLAAALNGTTGQAVSYRAQQQTQPTQRAYTAPTYSQASPAQTEDSGMPGLAIFFFVLLFLSIVGAAAYFIRKRVMANSATSSTATDPGYTNPEPTPNVPFGANYGRPRSYAAAASAPSAPSGGTTVINNGSSGDGLLTGVLIGEAMSRPSTPVYVESPAPTYVEPSYTPDPTPASQPDSTWEDTTTPQADTSFSDPSPSYDPPSSDSGFDSGGSSGDSSSGDSSF